MKIKMIKVFRGKINGEYKVYTPGDKATDKDAEYIKKNHPTWCEVIEEYPKYIGGGHYELSNQETIKGKENAIKAEKELR